jgi:Ca2+-binding EF-hand superfamily protein
LQYEWKNIYRQLNLYDKECKGFVTAAEFEQSAQKHGAYLSKEDISRILKMFPGSTEASADTINY